VSPSPLRVGVLGAGTVGREVVHGLVTFGARLASDGYAPLELAAVAVRDVDAARARGLPADLLTDAPAHVVADPAIDIVVELIGGEEPARTLVAAALAAGKPVVTANKHLLAHHGHELETAARRTGAALRFEAAVAGGTPVLGPLAADLVANRIDSVRGIVNGTTNHILSAMAAGQGSYEAVLRGAQERGYAEADPSADVEGRDAVNKLVVLARLAYGEWLDPACVVDRPPKARATGRPGITGVTATELEAAAALGLAIRLLAVAVRGGDGSIRASVVPTAVRADSAFGRTDGVRNRVEIRGEPVGLVGFDGPGAGGAATSSAVLADLAAIARGAGSTWGGLPPAKRSSSSPAAADITTWTRRWFGFVPSVSVGGRDASALREIADACVELASGTAVRTPLVAVEALPESLAVPWYPIDD
jgi:homoserine dehydrogenase